MKKELKTEITINASPEAVWSVLTDFTAYPEWNPFVASLTGDVQVGEKIKVELPGMNFTPVVTCFDENRKFEWLGNLYVAGLFDGRHSFSLEPNADGTTRFIHAEKFNGILVPLFKKMLDTKTFAGFKEMNEKLKERVEKKQAVS